MSDEIREAFEKEFGIFYDLKKVPDCDNYYHNDHTRFMFDQYSEVQRLESEIKVDEAAMNEQLKYRAEDQEKIDRLREALEDCKTTIEYCLTYVGGCGLSAGDDCNNSLELIKQALKTDKDGEQMGYTRCANCKEYHWEHEKCKPIFYVQIEDYLLIAYFIC